MLLTCAVAGPASASAQDSVSYHVVYRADRTARVHVRLELPSLAPGPRTLVIPRAIPMGYGQQPYDRFIERVRAFSPEGKPLQVRRAQGPRWSLGDEGTVPGSIEYAVDIARMEREVLAASDASKVRSGYLGLLGYSVFGFVEGLEDRPVRLEIEVPADWPVLTTLAPKSPAPTGRTLGTATNFYALADSQVIAGPDCSIDKLEGKVPLYSVLYSEGDADAALLGRLARETMDQVIDYFGTVPFEHYTVHTELLRPISKRHRYGFSMEHLDSGTFCLDVQGGLHAGSDEMALMRTRYNFAHHFAHAWIPKRAYGEGYYPFTWELAPVIDTVWLSEGFVQYAAIEIMADSLPSDRAGPFRERMLERRFRANLAAAPDFIRKMSLVELSRVASTRYSEDFRTGRNVFSRGGLMAAQLDELIRKRTAGAKRLRDALRHLVAWCGSHKRAFTIDELPRIFEESTGVNTREVFARWLRPIPGGGTSPDPHGQ